MGRSKLSHHFGARCHFRAYGTCGLSGGSVHRRTNRRAGYPNSATHGHPGSEYRHPNARTAGAHGDTGSAVGYSHRGSSHARSADADTKATGAHAHPASDYRVAW